MDSPRGSSFRFRELRRIAALALCATAIACGPASSVQVADAESTNGWPVSAEYVLHAGDGGGPTQTFAAESWTEWWNTADHPDGRCLQMTNGNLYEHVGDCDGSFELLRQGGADAAFTPSGQWRPASQLADHLRPVEQLTGERLTAAADAAREVADALQVPVEELAGDVTIGQWTCPDDGESACDGRPVEIREVVVGHAPTDLPLRVHEFHDGHLAYVLEVTDLRLGAAYEPAHRP